MVGVMIARSRVRAQTFGLSRVDVCVLVSYMMSSVVVKDDTYPEHVGCHVFYLSDFKDYDVFIKGFCCVICNFYCVECEFFSYYFTLMFNSIFFALSSSASSGTSLVNNLKINYFSIFLMLSFLYYIIVQGRVAFDLFFWDFRLMAFRDHRFCFVVSPLGFSFAVIARYACNYGVYRHVIVYENVFFYSCGKESLTIFSQKNKYQQVGCTKMYSRVVARGLLVVLSI